MKALATLLVLAVVAAALGLEGWQLRTDYSELRQAADLLQQSEQLLNTPSAWSDASIAQADSLRLQASSLLQTAQGRLRDDPGLRVSAALPWTGSQAQAVNDLVATGADGVAADGDLVTVARAYLQEAGGHAKIGTRLLSLIGPTAAPLADADGHLRDASGRLQADLKAPLVGPLAGQVQTALERIQSLEPRIDAAATLARVLPAAMGASAPRTYLIALPNPAELRPNGGLSAFVGLVTFDKGTVRSLTVGRSSGLTPTKPCFAIPTVLAFYLKFSPNCLDLDDAGWNPDFPTTAALMEAMFAAKTGLNVDGVISLDPYATSALLKVLGPLNVPAYGSFTADNLLLRLEVIVNVQSNYGVMSALSSTLMSNLLNAPVTRWLDLVTALQTSTEQRHLQLAMRDQSLENLLLAGSAGGAVMHASGDDYLMVVDANVSPNKADFEIQKSASVRATIQSSGTVQHEVDATYFYPNPPTPSSTDKVLNGDGIYRNYVRFYVPPDATVTGLQYRLDGHRAPAAAQPLEHDDGKLGVGMYFVLPRGHEGEVRLFFTDRAGVHGSDYRLFVQKQEGLPGRPTQIRLSRPGGAGSWAYELLQDAAVETSW